ncbi:alpha/beta fold hydrolase [Halopseudomonas xiamenensis]|uniref:alpha/beta fold hydrolase n=1 Tax=Halopseudomonas xiamenensis TaxID=157792 RepID=UPI0016268372|nr:alpha/beta fold hydrolase [Halopseudomonas xiamenensis]
MLHTIIQGQGWPLVWGHGQMSSIAQEDAGGWFHRPGADLIRRIRYDACGHGHSPGSRETARYRWPRLAQDMLEVARRHSGQPRFALGGQSMGCASALHAAVAAPDEVSHLVLALPPCAWQQRAGQARRSRQMATLIARRGLASLARLAAGDSTLPPWLRQAQPQQAELTRAAMAAFDAEVLQAVLLGAADSDLPPLERLRELKIPTLILAWHDDPLHPMRSAKLLAGHLPQAQLVIADNMQDLAAWPGRISRFVASAQELFE